MLSCLRPFRSLLTVSFLLPKLFALHRCSMLLVRGKLLPHRPFSAVLSRRTFAWLVLTLLDTFCLVFAAKSEVVYPILFKISSNTKTLYCGPVDWTAETGRVYVPDWVRSKEEYLCSVCFMSMSSNLFVDTVPLPPMLVLMVCENR